MRYCLLLSVLLAVPASAQGVFKLPAFKQMTLTHAVGQRPAETRLPMLGSLDRFRKSDLLITLGDTRYHISIQLMRDNSWAIALLEEGLGHRELSASYPYAYLLKGGKDTLGGKEYEIKYHRLAHPAVIVFTPVGGGDAVSVPILALKDAVWEKAMPVPSLGENWRMVFQVDLWRGAGMRSFVFLSKNLGGLYYFPVRAESVDWTEARIKSVGGRKVSLRIDTEPDGGELIIKPAPEEEEKR